MSDLPLSALKGPWRPGTSAELVSLTARAWAEIERLTRELAEAVESRDDWHRRACEDVAARGAAEAARDEARAAVEKMRERQAKVEAWLGRQTAGQDSRMVADEHVELAAILCDIVDDAAKAR